VLRARQREPFRHRRQQWTKLEAFEQTDQICPTDDIAFYEHLGWSLTGDPRGVLG